MNIHKQNSNYDVYFLLGPQCVSGTTSSVTHVWFSFDFQTTLLHFTIPILSTGKLKVKMVMEKKSAKLTVKGRNWESNPETVAMNVPSTGGQQHHKPEMKSRIKTSQKLCRKAWTQLQTQDSTSVISCGHVVMDKSKGHRNTNSNAQWVQEVIWKNEAGYQENACLYVVIFIHCYQICFYFFLFFFFK